jgi:hypothetical protein
MAKRRKPLWRQEILPIIKQLLELLIVVVNLYLTFRGHQALQ